MKESKTVADIPNLVKEWDNEKNGQLKPETVARFSKKKVWWICKEGHSWQAAVFHRTANGCPICSGKKVLPGVNDFATLYPEIAGEWDFEKNEGLRPDEIRPGSNVRVWWKCRLGHGWQISPNHRTGRGSGCPYCANQKVLAGYNDLESKHPELVSEWDMEKNEGYTPKDFVYQSNKKVWWICKEGHSWEQRISDRTRLLRGCPYCAGQRAIRGKNDLLTVAPDYLKEWDYEKNTEVKPDQVMPKSNRMAWWRCGSGHSWRARIYSREKNGCPYCSGRFAIKGETDLASQMPLLAEEWDYEKNNGLTPDEVACQSNQHVWWKCINGHSWKATVYERASGNGCPQCNGRIKMRTHYIS